MGRQAALGQGPRLPRLQGDARLDGARDRARELRGQPELHRRRRSGGDRALPARRRRREPRRVDHHAVDPALEPRRLRQRGARLCARIRRRRRAGVLSGGGAAGRLSAAPSQPRRAGALEGRGLGRAPLSPAVRLLRGRARTRRLRRGGRRLRHGGRRHRPGSPSAGLRRRRLPRAPEREHRRLRLPGDHGRRLHAGRARLRRPLREGGGRGHRAQPAAARRPVRPRHPRPQLSALLSHGQAAHLPRRAVLVRARDALPRCAGSRQRRGAVGARPRQARAFRQLDQGRDGLGHLAQPSLGHAAAAVGERRDRQCVLPRFAGRTRSADRRARRRSAPRTRRSADVHGGRRGRRLPARRGSAGLLVRVRRHALCAAALSVREPRRLRGRLSRRIHRRGPRSDARLVLHADGAVERPVRQAGLPQRDRQRHGARRRRQENVQEPAQLHAAGRTDGDLRRRCAAPVPRQLGPGARRGTALRRPRRPRHGAPRPAALVQRLFLPEDLR